VLDLLLQVCGDGRLTDGMGETVDFSNTVVIMTTNLGTRSGDVMGAIRAGLRPELLDRMDRVVVFLPLSADDARAILQLKLEPVRRQLRREHRAEVTLSPAAVDHLIERGTGPESGARELERTLTQLLVVPLTNMLAEGSLATGGIVAVDVNPGHVGLSIASTSGG